LCLLRQHHVFFEILAIKIFQSYYANINNNYSSKNKDIIDQFEDLFDDFKQLLCSAPQICQAINDEKETEAFFYTKFNPLKELIGGLQYCIT
jgi:hypothetical protein